MSRETEAILARWRELQRAVEAIDDPDLGAALERRIRKVQREYQVAVQSVLDQTQPLDVGGRELGLA